ncbi:ADP-ribosylglycohydrolase family protein [Nocardia sp. NPDC004278]
MLRRGDVFAEYVIERELGRGGMGAVYAAHHPRLPKLTALKLLHRDLFGDNEIRARFGREANLVATLDHPNIITVHDRGSEDEQLWIAMQFVDGVDSASVPLADMSAPRALQIIVQTADALDYAHRAGVLHRDVKPANILLSQSAGVGSGFAERVLLTDFGIARLLDDTGQLTRTGTLTATLAYASPEQLTGANLDHRTDQYSLACTLFRLLTGHAPFDSTNAAVVMLGHIQSPPPSLIAERPDLPAGLAAVMTKALAKDPQDRYASCTEFADAAVRALTPRPSTAPASSPKPTLAQEDIVHGCLLGGAIGDALGAPVEDMLLRHIRLRYGPRGVTGTPDTFQGRISDETQLTLFSAEALIKGSMQGRAKGIGGATVGLMQMGYLVWLQHQGVTIPPQPHTPQSVLSSYPELLGHRGTTHAAVTALQRVAAQRQPGAPLGTRTAPINDSKGCSAVVRAAPCGLDRRMTIQQIFELGCDAAALTHGNPSGWLPAGTMAAIIAGLSHGADLGVALDLARTELTRYDAHAETSTALAAAIELAARVDGRMPPPEDTNDLGHGWIGPEALAIGVFAALCAEKAGGTPEQIVRNGLLFAVNHSGDSDSTGAICGSILGARYGRRAIPREWRTALDAGPVIERLAADFCVEFGPTPPNDAYGAPTAEWLARYFPR